MILEHIYIELVYSVHEMVLSTLKPTVIVRVILHKYLDCKDFGLRGLSLKN